VLMIRSLAPALAAGATVVIKMPGQTAQANALTAKVISEALSLSRGVINLFSGTVHPKKKEEQNNDSISNRNRKAIPSEHDKSNDCQKSRCRGCDVRVTQL
jgi:hypothetical protein